MALSSPGVEVKVIDESFYTPAEPGTVPMVFVATASNKTNGAGTGTATGTITANAEKPYLITSQRELVDTFGDPVFYTDVNNNPVHGGELNEYGLQAAYSYLGVSNRAYVVRADIDLGALEPTATAPTANPAADTYWLDTASTAFGVFEWNGAAATTAGGQSFSVKTPIVITEVVNVTGSEISPGAPKASVGSIGSYALVAVTNLSTLWYKNLSNQWVKVGTQDWVKSRATVTGTLAPGSLTNGADFDLNGVNIVASVSDTVAGIASQITSAGISGITAAAVNGALQIYSTDANVVLTSGSGDNLLGELGITAGTYYVPKVTIAPHTQVPAYKSGDSTSRPTGSIWIKTTIPNAGANWVVNQFNGDTELFDRISAPVYTSNSSALFNLDGVGGGANLAIGDLYVKANVAEESNGIVDFKVYSRIARGSTSITSSTVEASTVSAGTYTFTISESDAGTEALSSAVTVSITAAGAVTDADLIAAGVNGAGLENVSASVDAANRVVITHTQGGEIYLVDTDDLLTDIGFTPYNVGTGAGTANLYNGPGITDASEMVATLWQPLTYVASSNKPTALATDGQLWYSSIVDEVDMMVHNGTTWVGFNNATDYSLASVTVSASEPTGPSTNDVWIDTSDLENYPTIYRWNNSLGEWRSVDTSDQTTEDGILFADARYGISGGTASTAPTGSISELQNNDYLDPDAPDPALYPKGMLLWNTRRSGFNVKEFRRNYVDLNADNARFSPGGIDQDMGVYYPHRWVTVSANQPDGTGSFGRIAQRKVVIQALQSVVNSNQDIRDNESRVFNLLAAPGYPELIGELITLNADRGLSAFIVGDSPSRLTPDATSLNEWGNNVNLAVEDNDNGLVSNHDYLGVFYPWGSSSDNAGNNVVVPPSHMMLRTIALSDQVSYPWFAPAGTRRGSVTNASSVGYVDAEGEFVSIALNEGQRDTLYGVNVNPVTFITGAGIVNFGQKTRASAGALDRINVSRLVIYLRSQLNRLAKPYIFEPNDKITRDQIKQSAESLLTELVGQRALYDFLVVCDESNNTPSRIDRNELYLDIAIEPVKAVEFIYIPLRLKNTGEIAGL
jgi:hypothetical protein